MNNWKLNISSLRSFNFVIIGFGRKYSQSYAENIEFYDN